MRQRSFFRHLAHEHRDRAPDCLIDVNNKDFVAIPDKNRATAAGGEHSTNMYLNDRFVHRVDGTDGRTKNKLLPAARTSFSGESRNGCFRGASVTHASPDPNLSHRTGQRSAVGFF
jgi:hypothetical protein